MAVKPQGTSLTQQDKKRGSAFRPAQRARTATSAAEGRSLEVAWSILDTILGGSWHHQQAAIYHHTFVTLCSLSFLRMSIHESRRKTTMMSPATPPTKKKGYRMLKEHLAAKVANLIEAAHEPVMYITLSLC